MFLRDVNPEKKKTVLLLHGQVWDGRLWDDVLPSLDARVLVPDLPGHGRSAGSPVVDAAGVRAQLTSALLGKRITEVCVAGYSLGTHAALGLALEGRVAVTSLWLLGPWPGADAATLAQFASLVPLAELGQLDWIEVFLGSCFTREFAAANPALVMSTRARLKECAAQTLFAELLRLPALEDFRPRLGELRMPVTVRVGAADPSTTLVDATAAAQAIPGARLEVVPGCAHHYLAQDFEGSVASLKR